MGIAVGVIAFVALLSVGCCFCYQPRPGRGKVLGHTEHSGSTTATTTGAAGSASDGTAVAAVANPTLVLRAQMQQGRHSTVNVIIRK